MPDSHTTRYNDPLRCLVYLSLLGLGSIILTDMIVQNGYACTILADPAIWTLPVFPLWWILIRLKKRTKNAALRIVLQTVISLLSFLPLGIAIWCTSHSWLIRPVESDGLATGFLLLIILCAITLCLLAISLLIGEVEPPARKKKEPSSILAAPESKEIGLINIEHNSAYDHVVITLNQYGKEVFEYWLTSLIPKYDHEFGCSDETSIQPSSGDDYTPCGFYNFSHAPVDDIYGEIQIKDYPGTLMLDANRNGIIRLLETVTALSEQQPETSCHANTVPDAHDIPKPYASVITFRFIKDVSAGMITPTET